MGKVVGIDLGTTNCCVAVLEGGAVQIVPNKEGGRTTPTVVGFTDKGERLVGQIAKRQAVTNAANTIYAVKRLIGRKFSEAESERTRETAPFEIVEASNGDARIQVQGRVYSPQEISGIVLQRLKAAAEDFLGEPVTEAIITVPAYFDDTQRQATKDAGKIAGLRDERIINWMVKQFRAETGIDLRQDRLALQRLKEAAERAKCDLSTLSETSINLPFIAADASGPKHFSKTLTRETFEGLISDLVERTVEPCQKALWDAKLQPKDVDKVLLVGGQTRSPIISRTVREIFGKEPSSEINPDEVVAMGAAIQGGVLTGDVKDIVLLDVLPLSLGLETRGGLFHKIIERNSTIPLHNSQTFTTVVDNQSSVEIHVLQGEREIAQHNRSLGKFELVGIPALPRGGPQIEVTFEVDANGMLNVSAQDKSSGRKQQMKVTPTSGLSGDEIDRMIAEAQSSAEADRRTRDLIAQRSRLEGLLRNTQRSFAEFGSSLSQGERLAAQDAFVETEELVKSENVEAIQEGFARLERVAGLLTMAMLTPVEESDRNKPEVKTH